ncbi:MAG: hypothetical protein RBT60_08890 [Candidatus Krumholzibacteria bacterium]|jgi:hypothetical protein|nr:hypothetical protein [Candidatus Krumholzibacteria bacterium]
MNRRTRYRAAVAAAIVVVLAGGACRGQDTGSPDLSRELDALYREYSAADSPALILLGRDIASIQRPSDPHDFALTLLQNIDRGLGGDAFGLEIAPYWLFAGRRLTYAADATRTVGQSLVRNLALSLAKSDNAAAAEQTELAVGLRTTLLAGRVVEPTPELLPSIKRKLADLIRIQAARAADDPAVRTARLARDLAQAQLIRGYAVLDSLADNLDPDDPLTPLMIQNQLDLLTGLQRVTLDRQSELREHEQRGYMSAAEDPSHLAAKHELERLFMALSRDRKGLRVDVAASAVWGFRDEIARTGKLDRWGGWLTAAHHLGPCDLMLVGRYQEDTRGDRTTWVWGERLYWQTDRMGFSIESLLDERRNHRYAGIVEYRARRDLWIHLTLGSDFERDRPGSLLAGLGLKWSHSRERILAP